MNKEVENYRGNPTIQKLTSIRLLLGDDERRAGTVSQKKNKEEDDYTLIYRLG